MNTWLSILCPSKRPEELDSFISSLRKNAADFSSIEVVVLVDDDKNDYVEIHKNLTVIHRKPDEVLSIAKLHEECYKLTRSPWIMFGNDDLICETFAWDAKIKAFCDMEDFNLIYPNDKMFGKQLACFPVVSRKFLELVKFFPQPYRRYKVDDTIFYTFPDERRIYLEDVVMTHGNHKGEHGYKLADGRIYPIDREAADYDQIIWNKESGRRIMMKNKLHNEIYGNGQTKVMIGVPTAEFARRADFYDYFNRLEKPNGTVMSFSHGQSPAKNRNLIIEQALENNCTHILFLDDDVIFDTDFLKKLMSHNKDIVGGFYLMRNFPHNGIAFDVADEKGLCGYYNIEDNQIGLIESVATGLGCILFKTEVFRKLEPPWIRLGELEPDQWCDDLGFFKRVREAGFKIHVDLDCWVGHIASCVITPGRINNKWVINYNTNGTAQVSIPMVRADGTNRENRNDKSAAN